MKVLIAAVLYGNLLLARLTWRKHPITRILSWLIPWKWLAKMTFKVAERRGIRIEVDWAEVFRQSPELVQSLSDEELEEYLEKLRDDQEYLELFRKFPILKDLKKLGLDLGLTRQRLIEILENEKFLREHRRRYRNHAGQGGW